MVVAEVPLWVVHPGSKMDGALRAGTATSASSEKNGGNPLVERAQSSLSLLESGGGGKCAIYSVDMNPQGTRFATGGGDCAVRIWNASSLFSKHRGRFDASGAYESSESSDGPSSSEDNRVNEESSSDAPEDNEVVHDLNSVVRRKKDGSTPVKPDKRVAKESKAPNTPSQVSPSKAKHSTANHRLLCTLSAHTGSSVLSVRFSTNGDYLASAGDDAVVCIYARSSVGSGGNLTEHSVEQWSRIKLCRGHTLDVVGLAWAPDDSHLVSCSLDSDAPIIVWRLTDLASENGNRPTKNNVLCNPYKVLGKGVHTSTVKGVTFDPAGSYLASSGDDPAVCIWRAHDDWGLERRVDSSSGIFRRWKQGEEDLFELSSQTMFRRLSWSTDGSYICSTNATVKNKHVASTISREGWSVSSSQSTASGAANLVGHKQPVVVSRHSRQLLDAKKVSTNGDEDDELDDEPEYATLLALGDKRGFVTVWSTRKSRPIFKLQCSESKCTVTDLSWGRPEKGTDLVLLVSLLDGHVVALRFGVPGELGAVLSNRDQARVFQLRYGMDIEDDFGLGRRRMFVGDNSGPKLIENALQMTLEEQGNQEMNFDSDADHGVGEPHLLNGNENIVEPPRINQVESRSKATGKKRIRPVLLSVDDDGDKSKKTRPSQNGGSTRSEANGKQSSDPITDALASAARAASAAEQIVAASVQRDGEHPPQVRHVASEGNHPGEGENGDSDSRRHISITSEAGSEAVRLPHSTNKIHSIDLPLMPGQVLTSSLDENDCGFVADCTNSNRVPSGSSGHPLSCTTLSISKGGRRQWYDEIVGTSCSSIAAVSRMLAVGTIDGCVYLYGSSPTLGWATGAAFRSHPPLVFGSAIVALQLTEKNQDPTTNASEEAASLEMLVVAADGTFGVYNIIPECTLIFKGSIIPAMSHMALSSSNGTNGTHLPKLARIQRTETGHLLLILSVQSNASRSVSDDHSARNGTARNGGSLPSVGVGGSLQAFVYHRSLELWMRVSDSRFVLSDFYSMLPASNAAGSVHGILSKMEDVVRSGSAFSDLKPSHRGRHHHHPLGNAPAIYHHIENESDNIPTRTHCEDRMACALALGSANEFEHWLSLLARTLSMTGQANHLRLLVDLLLGTSDSVTDETGETCNSACWWLSSAATVLSLNRKELVQKIVVTEMSKNRGLQRLTNEVSLELKSL